MANLNLYASALCEELATQLPRGRQLKILDIHPNEKVARVCRVEGKYGAWLPLMYTY
ncbi:MAG: hypothetical protein RMI92_11565 [Geminocystis sp.]|nr:hypothetical protein [Geminocystis sp.]MDW8462410.1 hypothetical protein [Geminocystis sp.]HIK38791.1 hypothetical protein [Geminocystis sp. M7585_C2015_104]